MRGLIIGADVYNKKNLGVKGKIVKVEDELVYIDVGTTISCVTKNIFSQFWGYESKPVNESEEEITAETSEEPKEEHEGVPGIGEDLSIRFINIVKSYDDKAIVVEYKHNNKIVVRYNGSIVFNLDVCRKKLVVYAHPNSLTPDNMRRCTKMYPKEWNKSLRAKFVFYELNQSPLMKSLISDGIYYRKNA